ncbi:hypothetical protein [Arthrobacter luteolus]|uniref:hypothetical protein n=1 Tax=Arthrobacter luteolus TaxID=98672 RepID=UPI000835FCD5|nr:hypothetical protein [Arthrobacter luteolus]
MREAFPERGIQNLIIRHKRDRSYERMAAVTNHALSSKRIQQLATQPMRNFPDPGTIANLAQILSTTSNEVLLACAVSLGLDVRTGDTHDLVLPGAGTLPESSQDLLLSMSAEMQELHELTNAQDQGVKL